MVATVLIAAHPCAAQDADALGRAGTAAIETRQFGDALEAFTKASAIREDDAALSFGAGVAAFMLGQDAAAQARFERAIAINPRFVPARTWLADLHYRAGHLSEAIAVYEAAQQRGLLTADLEQQLDRWRKERELQNRFTTVRTDHFVTLFESAGDEPRARDVSQRLEAIYSRVGRTLDVYPPAPVTVVLYSREQFLDITGLSPWSVAAYDGRIRVPIRALDTPAELDRLLSHEFVHVVVARLAGRGVPAWVNEGLATVLEPAGTAEMEATLSRVGARPALSSLHRSFVHLSTRDAEVAYASAARAVRRLIEQRGTPAVVALLTDLGRGASFDRAFHDRIALRYEEFAALIARE